MRKAFNNFILGIIILISTILIFSFGFYFFYWVERPMFSLKMLGDAVRTGNVSQFEQYVDLNSIYSSAYDDYVVMLVNKYDITKRSKGLGKKISEALAVGALKSLKSDVVSSLRVATLDSVANRDKERNVEQKDNLDISNLLIQSIDSLFDENGLKDLHADSLQVNKISSTEAEGSVLFDNNDKQDIEPLVVRFKMIKQGNNWKIVKILNVKEILSRLPEDLVF